MLILKWQYIYHVNGENIDLNGFKVSSYFYLKICHHDFQMQKPFISKVCTVQTWITYTDFINICNFFYTSFCGGHFY